ncbi:hypothetical protein [Streptosporangium sp. NPDC051022]|uniref:hypothetical protein n=1 Tax=Streptosporangium sp. NPDC051022 TaxID=3155752 RepID=UPI00344AEF6C
MRWPIAALAVALTASALVAGFDGGANAQTAQTAPADPVNALRRQMAGHGGVRFSNVIVNTVEDLSNIPSGMTRDKTKGTFRRKGAAEFGGGKVTASDVTSRDSYSGPGEFLRFISFPGRSYMSGWLVPPLPAGKEWVLFEDEESKPEVDTGRIRLTDPATLRAVLATTSVRRPGGVYDGTRTTLYEGKITFAELRGAYPGFRLVFGEKPTAKDLEIVVSWRLWIGEDHLVRRAWSSWTEPFVKQIDYYISTVTDVRLTGWGTAGVVPPPADQVVKAGGPAPDFTVHGFRPEDRDSLLKEHSASR